MLYALAPVAAPPALAALWLAYLTVLQRGSPADRRAL
jgi:hypothetical protein